MAEDGGARHGKQVGYGRPPVDHRIKPGEVRNPYGRAGKPSEPKDFLDGIIEITVDGKRVKVTRDEALDHALLGAAGRGIVGAVRELGRRRQERARAAATNASEESASPEQRAALDRYVKRRMDELKAAERAAEKTAPLHPGTKK